MKKKKDTNKKKNSEIKIIMLQMGKKQNKTKKPFRRRDGW